MATKIDKEACREAYNLVRDDSTDVNWVTFKYDGPTIVPGHSGVDYEEFTRQCTVAAGLFLLYPIYNMGRTTATKGGEGFSSELSLY
ncbi:UNVERIFIED_CONTAM: Coactosin-like protein [Gekko kuhli]